MTSLTLFPVMFPRRRLGLQPLFFFFLKKKKTGLNPSKLFGFGIKNSNIPKELHYKVQYFACFQSILMKKYSTIYFFPSLNRRAVIKLLKDICNKPGVDCTNLLNAFTGSICVHKLQISTFTWKRLSSIT